MKKWYLGAFVFFLATSSFAQGDVTLGVNLGITTSNQRDMNTLINNENSATSGLSVSTLGNAWEGNITFAFRVSGSVALQFRPGFFYQSADGSAGGNDYKYSVLGWTLFPVLKWYLLEDKTVKFFTNFGVGWGMAFGEVQQGGNSIEFKGNNLGYLLGLGAEFCFFGSSHCLNIEGNLRVLGIERVEADTVTGTWDGTNGSIDQGVAGREVEMDDRDLGITMSGVVGQIGYLYYF